jgi:hypothetical protein
VTVSATLYIRQKAKRGEIQPYLKTQNGERDVDVCKPLAEMLREHIGTRTSGCCFALQPERSFFKRTRSKTASIPS